LATFLAYKQPADVKKELADFLTVKKEQGSRSGIFTSSEVQNVFNLFDLKKEGIISRDRCIKGILIILYIAIQTMANSSDQYDNTTVEKIDKILNNSDKIDSTLFGNIWYLISIYF
jgi:hypothetical protein